MNKVRISSLFSACSEGLLDNIVMSSRKFKSRDFASRLSVKDLSFEGDESSS